MDLTLESLMDSLEKQAGLAKQAADESKAEEKSEKAEEKKDESEVKKDLDKAEKDFDSFKKKDEKEESKDEKSEDQEKKAQAAGAELADVIMQKVASANFSKETQMNKQASVAGKALAEALLIKLANAGDVSTSNGIPEGVAPNKNQIDNANLVAEQDASIKPMPTKDEKGNGGGSINQIFDAIVADALGQGAATPEQLDHAHMSSQEGAAEAAGTPGQVQTESAEKTAAVLSLVNSGVDFDSAVEMVKAAAEEIRAEEAEQVKQAAFAELIGKGVDFDMAVALVKSASEKETHGKAVARGARAAGRGMVEGAAGQIVGTGAGAGLGALAGKALKSKSGAATAVGAAIGGLVGGFGGSFHGTGRSIQNQMAEKRAAFDALCEAGVDFETAASLVQAKSQELYGA
jgi:hypothetical protein